MKRREFTLEDYARQLEELLRTIGCAGSIFKRMVAKFGLQVDDILPSARRQMAVFDALTLSERKDPSLIDVSRRRRIARGAGVSIAEVAQFIGQFRTMQRLYNRP